MALFRSENDRKYLKSLNKEIIEKVLGEKVTYYPLSKKLTKTNLYGEAPKKTFDAPISIYALIEWGDQEVTTNEFGQDVIYTLKVHILEDHLKDIDTKPTEGDMVDYNQVKFEITKITNPDLLLGRAFDNFSLILDCKSVRKGIFDTIISGTQDIHRRTRPDNYTSSSFAYTDVYFPFTGTVENL